MYFPKQMVILCEVNVPWFWHFHMNLNVYHRFISVSCVSSFCAHSLPAHYIPALQTAHKVSRSVLSEKPCAHFLSTISHRLISEPGELFLVNHTVRFRGCRPKWPLGFHQTHLQTLPYILLRVINYGLLALRGEDSGNNMATTTVSPQSFPHLHSCHGFPDSL